MAHTALEEANLAVVLGMFNNVLVPFDSSQVDKYIAPDYIQHNQLVDTGSAPLKAFLDHIKVESPDAMHSLKRSFADGDHVILHYHVTRWEGDAGFAVMDIFRLENGLIVEHWDVMQDVPTGETPNPNGVF